MTRRVRRYNIGTCHACTNDRLNNPVRIQFCDGSTDSNVQSYKYNGKEFDRMHGLNTYDYGARQYNPVTARCDRVDPLSEKYYAISPYAYCENNPVNTIDPDGNKIVDSKKRKAVYIKNDKIIYKICNSFHKKSREFTLTNSAYVIIYQDK